MKPPPIVCRSFGTLTPAEGAAILRAIREHARIAAVYGRWCDPPYTQPDMRAAYVEAWAQAKAEAGAP